MVFSFTKAYGSESTRGTIIFFINTYKIIGIYKCVSFLDTVKAKLMGITALVYITLFQKNPLFMIKQIGLCVYIYIKRA